MSPVREERGWDDVPALDRLREGFAEATARDARSRSPAPGGGGRLRPALALAALLVGIVVATLVITQSGDDAVADLRDAPQALLDAGSYAFASGLTIAPGGGQAIERARQSGTVDLRANAFSTSGTTGRGRRNERIGIDEQLFFRVVGGRGDDGWQRTALSSVQDAGAADVAGDVVPVSAGSVRALRDAQGERVVGEDEEVAGVPVTHYRLPMSAREFVAVRGSDAAATLRGVRGTLDVWLDDGDLPRRIRAEFAGEGGRRFTLDTRYERFGRIAPIRAPAEFEDAPEDGRLLVGDAVVASMVALFGD